MIDKYKAFIFDWDGTIVDTCGLILDAHNHVRKTYGEAEWTMEDFLGRASQSAREYYPTVYGDKADEAQRVLYEYVEEHHLNYLDPVEKSKDLLDLLRLHKMPMAVVSNKRHSTLHIEIEHTRYTDYFISMIGAGFAEQDKPSPAPLLVAMKEICPNLKTEEILYVGDTETDLLTAQNAGCDVVFIQSDSPRPDLIEKYKPLHAFHSLSEFYDAVTEASQGPNKAVNSKEVA